MPVNNPKGNPNLKPGPGRKKGTKDRQTARHIMDEMNYDPIKEMILLANSPKASDTVKMSIHRDLATYYVPRISSVSLADLLKLSPESAQNQIIKSIKIDYGDDENEEEDE